MKLGDSIKVQDSVLHYLGFGKIKSINNVSVSVVYKNGETGIYDLNKNIFIEENKIEDQ